MKKRLNKFIVYSWAILTSIPVAVAADAKHTKTSINIVEKKREKKSNSESSRGPRGPSIDALEIYAAKVETKLIKNIQKTLLSFEGIVRSLPPKSSRKADILLKMHDLSIEQAAYLSSQENRKYDKEFEAWDINGRKGYEPKLDSSQSKEYWQKVSNISAEFINEFPRHPKSDLIAFNRALAFQYLNKLQESAKAYSDLILKYQNSKLVGDAYIALGDYYFDRTDFKNALNNYNSALKYKKSPRFGFALFKSGWCYFNLGQFTAAIAKWKETVSYTQSYRSKSNQILKNETLRDMVYGFAEVGNVESSISYFKSNGGEELIGQFLSLLATTLADQGKFAQSIDIYQRILRTAPNSPEAPDAQIEIISLAYELGNYDLVWKQLASFPKTFALQSTWAEKNDKKKVREVQIQGKDQVLYYAKLTHKKAQDSENQNQYAQARMGYSIFLQNYPNSKEAVEVKFNLADILYLQKNFRDSGKMYLELTRLPKEKALVYDGKGQKDIIHQKAARYMLDAYSQDFDSELKLLMKEKPDATKPKKELSPKAKNFLAACGVYVKSYPEDLKTLKNCEVYAAEIYLRMNDKKEAKERLWQVALKYPDEPEGKIAAENIIPLYKDDKKGLVEAARKLTAIPAFQKGDLGNKLRDLLQGAEVESVASESDAIKRGDGWLKQAAKYPTSKDAPSYLYNASVDFLKAGNVDKAVTAYSDIINKYPNFDKLEEVYLNIAKIYDKQMEYGKAAGYYAAFAKKYAKSRNAGGALERNCRLRIALAPATAVAACEEVATYSREVATGAIEELIETLYISKNYGEMSKIINGSYLKKYPLSADQKIEALYKIYVGSGQKSPEGKRIAREILGVFRSSGGKISGPALRYTAEIVFLDTNDKFAKYLTLNLKGGTVQALQKSIVDKSNALDKLQTELTEVGKVGDAYWGVAALHQIGLAFEQFGRQLANPPGITGAEIAEVKKTLEPDSKAALGKALEFYRAAKDKQKQFSVFNDHTMLLANSLQRINASNIKFDDWLITPDFIGSEVPDEIISKIQ